MRRSAITSLVGSLLLGLVVACATGTSDDPTVAFEATSVKAPTEPAEEVKLPPASSTSTPAPSSSSPSPAPSAQDAGPPAQDAAPPVQTTPDCDINDPVVLLKLLLSQPSGACPCASDQCCLAGQCL